MGRLLVRAFGVGFIVGLLAAVVALWEAGWHGVANPPRSLAEVDMGMAAVIAVPALFTGWIVTGLLVFGALVVRRRVRGRRTGSRAV
jgi:hypothetical protein